MSAAKRSPEKPARMSFRVELRVEKAGGAALAALQAGPATVFAAFERSCYVETSAGIACLGGAQLGMGPLNAIVADFQPPPLNSRFLVRLDSARLWKPPVPKTKIGDGPRLPVPAPIQPQATAFLRWIAGNGDPDEALIGLGPGLTPAGDDFVGGAMIALRAFGHVDVAERIAAWALPLAKSRTSRISRISRAHLECAARGEGHEALHDWLAAPNAANYARLSRIGQTSGLDAAAGATLAISAVSSPIAGQHSSA
jgi:hypothetical protein